MEEDLEEAILCLVYFAKKKKGHHMSLNWTAVILP